MLMFPAGGTVPTVTAAAPLTVGSATDVATIVTVPLLMPVTSPLAETVATELLLDDQMTELLGAGTFASVIAVSVAVLPITRFKLLGMTRVGSVWSRSVT
jgi:hypothetical protein